MSSLFLTSPCLTFNLQYSFRTSFLAKTDMSSEGLNPVRFFCLTENFFFRTSINSSRFSTLLKTPLTISWLAFKFDSQVSVELTAGNNGGTWEEGVTETCFLPHPRPLPQLNLYHHPDHEYYFLFLMILHSFPLKMTTKEIMQFFKTLDNKHTRTAWGSGRGTCRCICPQQNRHWTYNRTDTYIFPFRLFPLSSSSINLSGFCCLKTVKHYYE